jgi:hypothetical protein
MGPRTRQLFVVETYDGKAFLGQIRRGGTFIKVYSGFRGQPPTVQMENVSRIVKVEHHPDVRRAPRV